MMGLGHGVSVAYNAEFSLSTLPGGLLLDLDSRSGITTVSGAVSAWADSSGSGDSNKTVTQATSGKRPAYTASDSGYNNQPTLSFASASSQLLVSGTWTTALTQPATIYIVGQDTQSTTHTMIDGIDASHRQRIVNTTTGGGTVSIYAGNALMPLTAVLTSKSVICGVFWAGNSALYVNSTANPATIINPGGQGILGTTVGAAEGGSQFMNGKIARILIFGGPHSQGIVSRVFSSILSPLYGGNWS